MSDKAAAMIACGLAAVAISYFASNLHETSGNSDSAVVYVVNKLTGSVRFCTPTACEVVPEEGD